MSAPELTGAFNNYFNSPANSSFLAPKSAALAAAPQPAYNVNAAPQPFQYTFYDDKGKASQRMSNINGASIMGALANGGVLGAPSPNGGHNTDWSGLWQLANQMAQRGGNPLGAQQGAPGGAYSAPGQIVGTSLNSSGGIMS